MRTKHYKPQERSRRGQAGDSNQLQMQFEQARANYLEVAAKLSVDELTREFQKARADVVGALDRFERAASMLSSRAPDFAPQQPGRFFNPSVAPSPEPPQQRIDDEMEETRAALRRLVGVLCDQTGKSYHEMWNRTYAEHEERTGYHAVVASKGRGTHLDRVVADGKLHDLMDTVLGMVKKYTRPSRVP